jgi:VanZ family protein
MSEPNPTRGASLTARLLRYWLPVALMLGLITLFSTDFFSSDQTLGFFELLNRWFGRTRRGPNLGGANFLARKLMHVLEYGVLTVLLFRAFRGVSPTRWRLSWCVYTFACVVAWSLLDETLQSATQTRSGTLEDSLLDSAGGLLALLGITLFYRLRRPPPGTSS